MCYCRNLLLKKNKPVLYFIFYKVTLSAVLSAPGDSKFGKLNI